MKHKVTVQPTLFLKKLKDKKLRELYQEAIDSICDDHTVGVAKAGDLSGIYGYDINVVIV